MFDTANLTAWCEQYDPTRRGHRFQVTRSHLDLYSNLLDAVETSEFTVSNAVLVGDEAKDAVNSSLQAKQNLPTNGTNPGDSNPFLDAFTNAPAAGATTMMDMARIASGFDPLDPDITGNVDAYMNYVRRILENPMFHLELNDRQKLQIKERDFNTLITDIANLFEGIGTDDVGKIKDGLVNLADAATSTKDVRQSRDLFIQNVMQIDDGDIKINIYYSQVSMIVHDGKSTTNQTDYTVSRTRLKFQKEFWNEVTAGAVAQRHFKDLSDWLAGNTTRQGDQQPDGVCLTV